MKPDRYIIGYLTLVFGVSLAGYMIHQDITHELTENTIKETLEELEVSEELYSPPKDWWGTQLKYVIENGKTTKKITVMSAGRDKTFFTSDDIIFSQRYKK